jgi:hypothetical protein
MRNRTIRETLFKTGIKHWELADAMGIRPESLSRKLRRELNTKERKAILAQIEVLKAEESR